MTYEQYWFGDPHALINFIHAEEMRQRKKNAELWLQGAYIYQAIGSLTPILNPFSKERKAKPYLKEPIALTEKEREEKRVERVNKFVDYMMKRVKKEEVG